MGDHGHVTYATATGNDYAEHEATYTNFIKLSKWGTAAIVALVVLMAIFLT